jgi:hypothetical protein
MGRSTLFAFLLGGVLAGGSTAVNALHIPTAPPVLSRRQALSVGAVALFAGLPNEALARTSPSPTPRTKLPDDDAVRPVSTPYASLPSGVKILDLSEGTGPKVEEGSMVSCDWTLRRQNGYFVDGSQEHFDSFVHRVGDGKAIKGFDQGILGMKEGGNRRILIPPSLGYVQGAGEGKPGPVPTGYGPQRQVNTRKDQEFFIFETRVTRVRPPKK